VKQNCIFFIPFFSFRTEKGKRKKMFSLIFTAKRLRGSCRRATNIKRKDLINFFLNLIF
jgi:hypothetical protein